jgi:hypothetical protein
MIESSYESYYVEALSRIRRGRNLISQEAVMQPKEELLAKVQNPLTLWAERARAAAAVLEAQQKEQGVAGVGRGKWGWGVRDTAALLGLSKTMVQTDLQLAKLLRDRP